MVKSEWNREFYLITRWLLRKVYKKYPDERIKASDWEPLLWLSDFEDELFTTYTFEEDDNILSINGDEWFKLCHKYLNKARKKNKQPVAELFFKLWYDLKYEFTGGEICDYTDYLKPATKEEIEFARKYFSHVIDDRDGSESFHTFSDDAKVLEYRKHRFILDNEWNDAWYFNSRGCVDSFQLIWDWNYPIDTFIDLYEEV